MCRTRSTTNPVYTMESDRRNAAIRQLTDLLRQTGIVHDPANKPETSHRANATRKPGHVEQEPIHASGRLSQRRDEALREARRERAFDCRRFAAKRSRLSSRIFQVDARFESRRTKSENVFSFSEHFFFRVGGGSFQRWKF